MCKYEYIQIHSHDISCTHCIVQRWIWANLSQPKSHTKKTNNASEWCEERPPDGTAHSQHVSPITTTITTPSWNWNKVGGYSQRRFVSFDVFWILSWQLVVIPRGCYQHNIESNGSFYILVLKIMWTKPCLFLIHICFFIMYHNVIFRFGSLFSSCAIFRWP